MKSISGITAILVLGSFALFAKVSIAVPVYADAFLDLPETSNNGADLSPDVDDDHREAFFFSGNPNPPLNPEDDSLVLFAGNDTTICHTGFYVEVSGYAENFYYTSWATTGDGFFDQATQLHAQYFPGPEDISNGLADLYLVGICVEPQYLRLVDSVKITLVPNPICFAGIDASVCSGNSIQMQPVVYNFSEVFWESEGDGTFDQPGILEPKYFHGAGDLAAGETTLSLTAFPLEPCLVAETNQMTLFIKQSPELDAGNDTILCEGNDLQLDADISYGNEMLWMTSGDGGFSDTTIPNPVYMPGNDDLENGGCMLSMIVTPEYPCETYATDNLELTITKYPEVSIGRDQTICEDDVVHCQAVVENYESLKWMALGGEGTFDDSTNLNPVYYPGEHEKTTGVFFLMLIVYPNTPCTQPINAFFKVSLQTKAMISAGTDQQICSNDTAIFNGSGENYEDVYWETEGDGTFIGQENLNRKYVPGPLDTENGKVDICLCALSQEPCDEPVCDTVVLFIEKPPTVNAGADATICSDAEISGQVENYTQVAWTTSGDGTFDDPGNPMANYFAGPSDIETLEVVLTLSAQPVSPCEGPVADDVTLTIDRPVLFFSGMEDQEVFAGSSTNLGIEVSSLQGVDYQWYFNDLELQGANTSQLTLNNCQPEDAGYYYCMFGNDCFSFSGDTALISVLVPSEQTINFNSGWSAVSSYVVPAAPSLDVVLMPILDDLIILYSNDGIYYPGQDMQTFNNWNSNTGYIVKTTASDNISLSGYIKYPPETIVLEPGWSFLPGGLACPMNPGELFAGYPEIKAIKEIGGFRVFWPEHGIYTLQNINPGKAYEIYNASSADVLFTFPECGK